VPLHADGDGHCLVHAVSRALTGRELFWHPLRVGLKQHFDLNIDKYKVRPSIASFLFFFFITFSKLSVNFRRATTVVFVLFQLSFFIAKNFIMLFSLLCYFRHC
jgi:hypothetical protein